MQFNLPPKYMQSWGEEQQTAKLLKKTFPSRTALLKKVSITKTKAILYLPWSTQYNKSPS